MAFAMLLGSMNYNNNLSFVLTFMLAALGLVAMHQCQRNLVALELSFAGVEPVFAGQAAQFRIAVTNHSKSARHGIMLYTGVSVSEVGDLPPGESQVFTLAVPTDRRGWLQLERFGIRTFFPFELFRNRRLRKPRRVIASTMRVAKKTSQDCAGSMRATRPVMSPGKRTRAADNCCPSSSPVPTRAASGSISIRSPSPMLKRSCRF
jgi:uncharacterized protein (DUF58 family)